MERGPPRAASLNPVDLAGALYPLAHHSVPPSGGPAQRGAGLIMSLVGTVVVPAVSGRSKTQGGEHDDNRTGERIR